MRVLMLAHRVPYPPHTGDKVRAYHVARHLAARHQLTLGFLVDDPGDCAAVAPLARDIGDIEHAVVSRRRQLGRSLLELSTGGCLSRAYFYAPRLATRVRQRLAADRYDVVYLSSSPMARYVEGVQDVPVVMDFVDVDSDKWRQYADRRRPPLSWAYRLEARRLRKYEGAVARRAHRCLVSTPVEASLLASFAPWARTAVIANGVDLAHYAPAPTPGAGSTIVFTGAMDYLPNVDAVEHFSAAVFPRVRAQVPDARFVIVGLNPAPGVRRLERQPGIEVTGTVPDVRPYYASAAVCVAPLRLARGVQNKMLQAMAAGLPVVASSAAARGLGASAGEHLLVADDPGAFAAHVVDLLRQPERRRALGQGGRAYVETHHSWDAVLGRLDGVLADLLAERVTGEASR